MCVCCVVYVWCVITDYAYVRACVRACTGTIIAALSFALSSSIDKVVTSLYFLLVTRPYDVGDRIQIGLFRGEARVIVSVSVSAFVSVSASV